MPSTRRILAREQVRLLYRNSGVAFTGALACLAVICVILATRAPSAHWAVWGGATLATYLLRILLVLRYRRLPAPVRFQFWRNAYLVGVALSGCCWGLGGFILPGQYAIDMLFLLVVAGLGASTTTAYCAVRGASAAFVVPSMVLLAISFVRNGGEVYAVMTFLVVVHGLLMLVTAERLHASVRSSLVFGLENQRLAEDLHRSEEQFRQILDNVQDVVYQTDLQGNISYVSPSIEQLLRYPQAVALGMNVADMYAEPSGRAELLAELEAGGGRVAGFRAELRRRDGSTVWTSNNAHFRRDRQGQVVGVEGVVRDVTENKLLEDELWHLANFDHLTGIPGRRLFYDRLSVALAQAKRSGQPGALMFIDLNGFKDINDEFGHAAGDDYLCEAARRLLATVRKSDTVARIGGDEFTVLLPEIEGSAHTDAITEKIRAALGQPIALGGRQLAIEASIGVSVFPGEGDSVDVLMKNADAKMYGMKLRSKGARA